eukprot:scaffold2574_cov98-Cylindrotheca_fusiformis.AAC.3
MSSRRFKTKTSQTDNVSHHLTPLRASSTRNRTKAKTTTTVSSSATAPPPPPCRFFAIHGNCRFGDLCAFSHDIGNAQQEVVCQFFLRGNCRYGNACRLSHSSTTSPSQPFQPAQQQGQEVYTCGICLEQPKKFGLLSGCNHTFCFSCLMKWRTSARDSSKDLYQERTTTTSGSSNHQQVRACPECRNLSDYVVPSSTFAKSGEGKEEIIDTYKERLSRIPCKHFSGELGSCPFGRDCFYLHLDDDGIDIKNQDKSLQEIHAAFLDKKRGRDDEHDDFARWEEFLIALQLVAEDVKENTFCDDGCCHSGRHGPGSDPSCVSLSDVRVMARFCLIVFLIDEEYSESVVSNFIRARLGIAILRATHHCIRGPRIPASKMSRHIEWTGPAGLALF